jgi:cyclopropane fatty-acyl-phospholipid synthase-like methyltransferase
MEEKVDLYHSAYGNLEDETLADIRRETYGRDIGQSSWITVDEYENFCERLGIDANSSVLEVASGSGGPALYLAEKYGCRVTGVDINESGIASAKRTAERRGIPNAGFHYANVDEKLPFDRSTFDAIICIDAANHFRDRLHVLREWYRVLKAGGRILFTDPVVITGPVTSVELADRSNIGLFIFVPQDVTEKFIRAAGLRLISCEDVTGNVQTTSKRWLEAREKRREALTEIEGEERYLGLQRFLTAVSTLTAERRLSRFAFLAEKQ